MEVQIVYDFDHAVAFDQESSTSVIQLRLCSTLSKSGKVSLSTCHLLPIRIKQLASFFFQGFDNRTLACLFNVGRMTIWKTWWRVLFHAYNMSEQIPKMWTRPDLKVIQYHFFLIICKISSASSFSGQRYQ